MKNIYFVFSLISATSLSAQLTQSNHAPANGQSYEMYQCDSLGISPGANGAGAVWNFSAIATHSSVVNSYTVSANANASYTSAGLMLASTTNTQYLNATTGDLTSYGGPFKIGLVSGVFTYTAPALQAVYPMSLNTSSVAVTGGSLSTTTPVQATGTFSGTSVTILDGTGTLMLPNMTYTNVYRVITTQTINFVTNVAPGTLELANFDYFSPGEIGPLFSIQTATATVPFVGASTQTFVLRSKGSTTTTPTGISMNTEEQISVYPNPASSTVSFATSTSIKGVLNIFDLTGKLVKSADFDRSVVTVDVSQYPKGLYVYRITGNGGQVQAGKFTVVH